jgi:hemerythrin
LEVKKMSYREWRPEYNVSVKAFNDDHKKLFGYLNDLQQGISSGLGVSNMGYILRGLVEYTVEHFKREEVLMEKYNFPEYTAHKDEHTKLLEEVGQFYSDFQEGKSTFSLELLSFLSDWVTNHILNSDMKYKYFFKEIADRQKAAKQNVKIA